MITTKLFSSNTSENVRHSAVKSLYAECFAVYYRGCHLKETSQNRLLLTSEKSLTMKQPRSLPNNSDGIFSVSFSVRALDRFSIDSRSSSVHPPFILRSSSVRAPFNLRSSSVQPPFELRSTSVHPPFVLRSFSVRESKIDRRTNGESSEAKRRCIETLMGNQGKGDSNKSFILNHLNSNYYGKTYPWLYHFSASSHSAYWKSMSYVKLMGGFGWCIDEVRSNSPLLWYRILI